MFQSCDGVLAIIELAKIWFTAAALWANIIADFVDGSLDNPPGLVIVIALAKGRLADADRSRWQVLQL
jgi:hypothetical protein